MPRISAEQRAQMCSFTYSDGRRCRQPHSSSSETYCPTHARKLREQREAEILAQVLTQPLDHPNISSTSLTFILVRLFAGIAHGRIKPRAANSLIRVVEAMRKTLPETTVEYSHAFDLRNVTEVVRQLYDQHLDLVCFSSEEPTAPSTTATPDTKTASPSTSPTSNAPIPDQTPGTPHSVVSQPPLGFLKKLFRKS